MKTSTKKMPALRFTEFEGKWESSRIGKIFAISAGGDIDKEHVREMQTDEYKYPIYANAAKGKGFYGYSDIYKVDAGMVTIAGRGVNIGITHARDHRFYPIVRLLVLKPKNGENIKFFEYVINNLNIFVESTGVPQLTVPQISSYKICFCNQNEQQKIADFLTGVDDKINQLTKKKALLEQYKKGVMQKIFSQEICFKDENGNDFPEWEEKNLGNCFYNKGGTSLEKYVEENGKYKFISIGNYSTNGKYVDNLQRINLNDKTSEKLLNKNELVMVLNDKTSTGNLIGATILIDEDNSYIYNQRSERLIPKEIISPLFAWFTLNSKHFRSKVVKIAQGGTQIYVNFSNVTKLKIDIPSIPEQQKIANFLTGIDKKIELVNIQLEKTQQFKKGLLQQMFV